MKLLFISILFVELIATAICMVLSAKKKQQISSRLAGLYSSACLCIIFQMLSYSVSNVFWGIFFVSFYWISFDFVLYFMLSFTVVFTTAKGKGEKGKDLQLIVLILLFVDILFIAINPFMQNAFKLQPVYVNEHFGYWIMEKAPLFTIHDYFNYILALDTILLLLIKIIKSPRFYSSKYLLILIGYVAAVVLDFVFVLGNAPFDFALLVFAPLAVGIYYFAFTTIPLKIRQRLQRIVTDKMDNAVATFDCRGKCIYINESCRALFDVSDNDFSVLEKFVADFSRDIHDDFGVKNVTLLVNGEENIFAVEYQKLMDKKGQLEGSYINMQNQTDEVRKLELEKFRASHDSLTGLLNKNSFFTIASQIIKSAPDIPRYLVATDIKDFKIVNDLFGTKFGDDLLKQQAEMLLESDSDGCIQGRISGDKFAMLITKDKFNAATAVRNTNRVIQLSKGVDFKFHVYIGIYEIINPYESIRSMYDKANLAIQSIHGNFQQSIAFYTTSLMEQLLTEKNIISEFDAALEKEEFKLFFQPQVDKDGKLLGAEALVRWLTSERGLVAPGMFIPILEKAGFIFKLDNYIWEKAAQKLAEWKKAGRDELYISVNISTKDFYYMDLYKIFTELVQRYGFSPRNLKLEITETVLMHNIQHHLGVLTRLQQAGFEIEMDDFGSGFSSLCLLKEISVDVLKIDMGFLRQTQNPARSKIILKSIISMAQTLGMQIVTEGVETIAQLKMLCDMGCKVFQGYYFSSPVSVRDFEQKYMGGKK